MSYFTFHFKWSSKLHKAMGSQYPQLTVNNGDEGRLSLYGNDHIYKDHQSHKNHHPPHPS